MNETTFFADPLHSRLAQMLKLQDEMNAMVNPQWRTAGYAWSRAILVESVELLEHFGQWKWWKKGSTDLYQAQLELVDIWHFALSWYMVRFDLANPTDWVLVQAIARRMRAVETTVSAEAASAETINKDIERLAGRAADGLFDHESFVRLMDHFGLTFETLFQMYVGKNALNRFRQTHGYKQGAYLKDDWAGEEDNAALEKLLPGVLTATNPLETLLSQLESRYQEACLAKDWFAVPAVELGKFRVVEGPQHAAVPGAVRLPYRVG